MLLQNLDRKEKLKFLDLALHMVKVGGPITAAEQKLLDILVAEIGSDIVAEYNFELSANLSETIEFFVNEPLSIRKIVYLNLLQLALVEEFYNTSEHFFLEDIEKALKLSKETKSKLMRLIDAQKDLLVKINQVINEKAN